MSASVLGKLGSLEVEWLSIPRGLNGQGRVRVGSETWDVSWRKDRHGVWIELPHGTVGFDLIAERDDEGKISYRAKSRRSDEAYVGLRLTRAGETAAGEGGAQKKKALRVRAQMPGKIIRLNVKVGQNVEKDQVLLVMEAMKMENPIKASHSGVVSKISVIEGQAVETGADLLLLGE